MKAKRIAPIAQPHILKTIKPDGFGYCESGLGRGTGQEDFPRAGLTVVSHLINSGRKRPAAPLPNVTSSREEGE